MPTATRRGTDNTSTPSRLVVTIAFAAVALFLAAEPYLIPWATQSMQLFQGAIMLWLWLLFMFGTNRN
jgi:hypothetical protein